MSKKLRILLVDYIAPADAKECGLCDRRVRGECLHFGVLARSKPPRSVYLRHEKCVRAEERTRHAAISQLLHEGDFSP